MPFLGIDAQGEIDLYVFDPTDIAGYFPWKLGVGVPSFTHGEEGGVRYRLRVGGYAVVLGGGEVDVGRAKAGEDVLYFVKACLGSAMFDKDLARMSTGVLRGEGLQTSGWPRGSTFGPWREWHEMICTSSGRCFSKAAISGALQEVWPPTIAPCLVAVKISSALRCSQAFLENIIHGPY